MADLETTDDGIGSTLRAFIVIPVSAENLTDEEKEQIASAIADGILEALENGHDNPEHSDRVNSILMGAAAVVNPPETNDH